MLEVDRIVLQEVSRLESHGVFEQMRQDFREVVVNPSLGPPIDEVHIGVVAANRNAVFPGCNSL